MGLSMGLFASPNRVAIMNSLPPQERGAGAGMTTTFQNSATVLSIGIFFSVITVGLAASLPAHLYAGLTAQGVPAGAAHTIAHLPPIGILFASFLGYNPVQQLLGPSGVLQHLTPHQVSALTGHQFFPALISSPFAPGRPLRIRLRHRLLVGGSGRLLDAGWQVRLPRRGGRRARSRRAGSTRSTSPSRQSTPVPGLPLSTRPARADPWPAVRHRTAVSAGLLSAGSLSAGSDSGCSSCTYRFPRDQEAMAATTHAKAANPNASTRPE